MKNYLFCIVIMAAHEAICKTAQENANDLFRAIDTLEEDILPKTGLRGDRQDFITTFRRAIGAVRKEIIQNPSLIVDLGTMRNSSGESLIGRALRLEKMNGFFPFSGVDSSPEDYFQVLQPVMTVVVPDKEVYALAQDHANAIANVRGGDTNLITESIKLVLSGIDALSRQWNKSPLVAQKIFNEVQKLDDSSLPQDARSSIKFLIEKAFLDDDITVLSFIFPWAYKKFGNNVIPWQNLSGEKVKNFLLEQNIKIPARIKDPLYIERVENALLPILIRRYDSLKITTDDDVSGFRNFLIEFLKDTNQELDLLYDEKSGFINPLTYAVLLEDEGLLKAMLIKNPTLGEKSGYLYIQEGSTGEAKSGSLYDTRRNPEFFFKAQSSGLSSSYPKQNPKFFPIMTKLGIPLTPDMAEKLILPSLQQLAESLSKLSRQ